MSHVSNCFFYVFMYKAAVLKHISKINEKAVALLTLDNTTANSRPLRIPKPSTIT